MASLHPLDQSRSLIERVIHSLLLNFLVSRLDSTTSVPLPVATLRELGSNRLRGEFQARKQRENTHTNQRIGRQ